MNYKEHLDKMIEIQQKLLEFLDKIDKVEENYQNFIDLLSDYNIKDDKHELRSILYLINKISKNHYRIPNFFNRIEKILQYLADDIKKNITNIKIYDIFKNNKALLLILIQQKILFIDQSILKQMILSKNYKFFILEIKEFIKQMTDTKELCKDIFGSYQEENLKKRIFKLLQELPENFNEKRKIGQNDNYICQIIRKDLIEDFIIYINKNKYPLNSKIEPSIFETNSFLLKQDRISIIEYAAFFGSIQIFKYLYLNNATITAFIWQYAVHGDNAELIQLIEEKVPLKFLFDEVYIEAVKCHHNDIVNYIRNINDKKSMDEYYIEYSFRYYNYALFPTNLNDKSILYYLCKYDYFNFVKLFLENKAFNPKEKTNNNNILFILFLILFLEQQQKIIILILLTFC